MEKNSVTTQYTKSLDYCGSWMPSARIHDLHLNFVPADLFQSASFSSKCVCVKCRFFDCFFRVCLYFMLVLKLFVHPLGISIWGALGSNLCRTEEQLLRVSLIIDAPFLSLILPVSSHQPYHISQISFYFKFFM
jgi:hypothetical protein